jgi:hypothetical protein
VRIAITVSIVAGLVLFGARAGQAGTVLLAQASQAAPDGNGAFLYFSSPSLNDAGQVVFGAELSGTRGGTSDNNGIFLASGGTISQLVRTGQAAPGGNGVFSQFSDVVMNDAGQVAFSAVLSGTSGGAGDNAGLFLASGSTIVQIARKGQSAVGGNGVYSSFGPLLVNDAGGAAFRATLSGTAGGSSDNSGIYFGAAGALSQVARTGQAVPGGNGAFQTLSDPSLNNTGQVAFGAVLSGTSGGASDSAGVYQGGTGGLAQIVRAGQSAAGGSGLYAGFGPPVLNGSSVTAFYCDLNSTPGGATDNEAIVRVGSSTTQIVRTGQAAPGGNGTFSYLDYPVLSSNGQVAFWAQLTGTSGGSNDNSGLFRSSGAALVQLARTSQAAPDGNGQFSWLYEPAINASGQAGFYADLTNTSGGSADDAGIYLADGTRIAQVARDGQLLGDATINRLTFSSLAGQSGLNDEGAVAYWASLTHGKEVVALYTSDWALGDVNHDGAINSADIDDIYRHFGAGPAFAQWDVNGDGVVNQGDVTAEVISVMNTTYGDTNLDRRVNFADFQTLLDHWNLPGAWATGDFTGDSLVNFADFQKVLDNWNPMGTAAAAPEPGVVLLALGGLTLLRARGRGRTTKRNNPPQRSQSFTET